MCTKLETNKAAAPLWKQLACDQSSFCSILTWAFNCFTLVLLSPLSFFRALLLSYLAFSSLSPSNLFYLLSPTITPFLIIVSIPFFCSFAWSRPGGPSSVLGAPRPASALSWHLGAGALSPACRLVLCAIAGEARHALRRALYICFAGADVIYQSAEQQWIRSLMQIRSSHMARSIWEHFRLKRKKKKEKTEKDAAVKNTNIGSSRNPPYCIHYYNLLICSGLMLSILRLSWICFPNLREGLCGSHLQEVAAEGALLPLSGWQSWLLCERTCY